ncbi:MAG: helix-turn-helix domain-containing protein [Coprococcus sp.]
MNINRKKMTYYTPKFPTHEALSVLQCGYEKSLPGHFSTQKTLDHYVLHCITSGKGTYTINNHTYHLGQEDCFLLLPDVPILYQADLKEPWVYYWIGFTGAELPRLLSFCIINDNVPVIHFENIQQLTDLIAPLIDGSPRQLSSNYYALGQLYQILAMLINSKEPSMTMSRKEFYAEQAVSYIRDNFSNDITVQDIAHHIGLDRTYLYRSFKEIMGVSIQTYIQKIRLEKACHLLKYSNLSLSQIASFCGYSSAQHFSAYFKKNMKMSPSQYRKNNLSNTKP